MKNRLSIKKWIAIGIFLALNILIIKKVFAVKYDLDTDDTITNVSSPTFNYSIGVSTMLPPSTPSTGGLVYESTDTKLYFKNAAGTEYDLTQGGGSTSPGGSDTQMQYNNSNAFGGISGFTYNGTTVAITIPFEVSTITWSDGTVQISSPTASGGGGVTDHTQLTSTGTNTHAQIDTSLSNLDTSTTSLRTDLDAVILDTGTLSVSTTSLRTDLDAVILDTGTLSISTTSLRTDLDAVAVDTGTLSVSTTSLKVQIDAVAVDTGTNATAIALNTTHRTSDGSDHTFIDQDVTTTGTPTFLTIGIDTATTTCIDMEERVAPGIPAANVLRLYTEEFNGFSLLKYLDDGGMKREFIRDSIIVVKNVRGTTIAASRIVYASGSEDGVPTVDTAKSDDMSTMPAIGITIESINNGDFGRVMQVGLLENVNTSSYDAGDILYVSDANAGVPVKTVPSPPSLTQEIGTVLVVSASTGTIQIIARGLTGDEYGTAQNIFYIGDGGAGDKSLIFNGVANSTMTWDGTNFSITGYVDQDVTSGSSPTLDNANMTGNISVWTNDAGYATAAGESTLQIQNNNVQVTSPTASIDFQYGLNAYLVVTGTSGVILDTDTLKANDFVSNPATATLDMNSNAISNVTTLDTGQGANELYAMDQDVQTTDTPVFSSITITNSASINGIAYTWPSADGDADQFLQTDGAKTLSWATSTGSDNLGNHVATTTLNMNSNLISNVTDPSDAQDAATKYYVDANFLEINDGATTYLRIADAATTYLLLSDGVTTYLGISDAGNTYLSLADATTVYLKIADATTTYLEIADATTTYLEIADAATTYMSLTDLATTYVNVSSMTETYVQKTSTFSILVPISAASLAGTITNGISGVSTGETSTNNVNYDFVSLSSSTTTYFQFSYSMPTGWDESTVTYYTVWTATEGAGGVAFNLQALARSNDEALDTAYGTAINIDDTFITAEDVHITAESAALTVGGTPAENDYITWRGYRDVDDAGDTLTGNALLLEIRIKFTRNYFSD